MSTKVRIDRDNCIGCGACTALVPDFFELNVNDGKAQIVEKYRSENNPALGDAPNNLLNDIKSAAEGCPVNAIRVD